MVMVPDNMGSSKHSPLTVTAGIFRHYYRIRIAKKVSRDLSGHERTG
jgi:hypothetical protein